MVGEPKEYPVKMVRAMSDYFKELQEISSAYLKLMVKDGNKSYLVALNYGGKENPTEIYNKIDSEEGKESVYEFQAYNLIDQKR